MRTYRLVFRDSQNRRCTTFIDAQDGIDITDITEKIPEYARVKIEAPSIESIKWATGIINNRKNKKGGK